MCYWVNGHFRGGIAPTGWAEGWFTPCGSDGEPIGDSDVEFLARLVVENGGERGMFD